MFKEYFYSIISLITEKGERIDMQNNTMFENFEDFQKIIKKEGKNIRSWPLEQQQAFSQNVLNLFENDEDFKLKYEAWIKQIEKQVSEQKGKIDPITLDTKSTTEAIKNQIKLQQIREYKAAQNVKNIDTHKKDKPIIIGGSEKDNQENKKKLENIRKSPKAVNIGIIVKKKRYRI